MKKTILLLLGICFTFFACQTEQLETLESQVDPNPPSTNYTECSVIDADRSPFEGQQPASNFWWSETPDASDFFNMDTYFSSDENNNLVYREYDDGTVNILGTTVSGTCLVTVDMWLKDKKTFAEFQAIGGAHKKEGTAGNASNSEDMTFYIIDSERSSLTAAGGDCVQEGTFGMRQRPGPNNPNTPNFGAHVGIGGANYDSDLNALGFSTWAWLTDQETGEDVWLVDFNFVIEDCEEQEPPTYTECEIIDADRSPFEGQQPASNFWWSETPDASDFFNMDTYFSSDENNNLVYREYDDGTVNILGTTVSGTCVVTVDMWLKDKKTFAEFQAIGGAHKKEGTAGNASNSEDMTFYIIDSERSSLTAVGGDCVQEGTFGMRQRPGPNNPNTPNFGAHVGIGGANYDSDLNALGFSTWAWLTDPQTGEDVWLVDFNFVIECDDVPTYTECEIIDADRSPFEGQQPASNFWWSETPDASDFFDMDTYFSSDESNTLVFREYDDGTANVVGTTVSGTCVVTVDMWLKDKKTFAEFQAIGGAHKKEGTAGNASNSEDMTFYIIDSERSSLTASGGDCVQEGTFGMRQRPGPNNPNTPNFGAHVGIGGANYDSDLNALGFSTWAWLTDPQTGEDLWLVDFNFVIECE